MTSLFAFLTATVTDSSKYPALDTASDKLIYGLEVTAIGMLMVFFILVLLMLVVYLFKLFFYTIPNKKNEHGYEDKKEEVSATQPIVSS